MFEVDKIDTQESVDIESSWPCDLGGTWPNLDLWKDLTLAVRWSTPFISLPCPSSCFVLFGTRVITLSHPIASRTVKWSSSVALSGTYVFFWFFAPAQPPNENTFTHKASHKRGFCSTCSYVWTLQAGAWDQVRSVCWEAEFRLLRSWVPAPVQFVGCHVCNVITQWLAALSRQWTMHKSFRKPKL